MKIKAYVEENIYREFEEVESLPEIKQYTEKEEILSVEEVGILLGKTSNDDYYNFYEVEYKDYDWDQLDGSFEEEVNKRYICMRNEVR